MQFNSSVQTVSWFRDRYRDGSLIIRPPFQRKPVWAARQKCSLIESILLGLPVPEVYIQQTTSPEGDTTHAIVDGQQRIRTVLQFVGAEFDPDEEEHNKFVLDKLDLQSPWRNLAFDDLKNDEKKAFYEYNFAVRFLTTEIDADVRDMFKRLNKYMAPLKPQELRNATYDGPFARLSEKLADAEYWAENRIIAAASIRRMGDVEFVSELLIGVMHGPQGGGAKIIDEYYEQYEDYDDGFPNQRSIRKSFEETLNIVQDVLPNIKETRWGNKTDFYTLFVVLSGLLRSNVLPKKKVTAVRKELLRFAKEVDVRLGDEQADVSEAAVSYVRAVEKGANDKRRRADRHLALTSVIEPYFTPKKSEV